MGTVTLTKTETITEKSDCNNLLKWHTFLNIFWAIIVLIIRILYVFVYSAFIGTKNEYQIIPLFMFVLFASYSFLFILEWIILIIKQINTNNSKQLFDFNWSIFQSYSWCVSCISILLMHQLILNNGPLLFVFYIINN